MRIPPYETTKLSTWNSDEIGIWVRAEVPGTREELQAIGEHVALSAVKRSRRVFVWIYASDMRPNGPAFALTYMEAGAPKPLTSLLAGPLLVWAYSGAGVGRA